MTDDEYDLIQRLNKCSFYPGSFDKKFVKSLQKKKREDDLSLKQLVILNKLAYSYRGQLKWISETPVERESKPNTTNQSSLF